MRPWRITTMRSGYSRSTSGSSDEIITIAQPRSAQLIDHVIDFVLRADVDAARRFVENHHLQIGLRPASATGSPSADCRPTGSGSSGGGSAS